MTKDSIELTLHCLRSIRHRIEPDADAPMDGVWGLQDEVLAADLEGLSIAEDFFARHAEHADALTTENATLREERDAARAERDARPDITAEDAAGAERIAEYRSPPYPHADFNGDVRCSARVVAALREHAWKVRR